MKKILKKLKELYNKETPLKIEWVVAILIAVLMLITFSYIDLRTLTIWSTNVLDCIAEGNLSEYFAYTSQNIYGAPHTYMSGNLYMFIPWAIWNIPIWILQYFFEIKILQSPLSLIWSQLFLVAMLILTVYYSNKIIMHLTKDKIAAKWANFLSFTYCFTYVAIFYAGQNDIMLSLLGTMAIYYLIKGNKKAFYILSSFAITMKYFFLIPFILIVLLTEKNILKAIRNILLSFTPLILFNLICYNWPMYIDSGSKNGSMTLILKKIIGESFPMLSGRDTSFVILSLVILAFIAYKTIPKSKKELNEYIIYLSFAGFAVLFLFSGHEFYRMSILMPFMFIMFALNKDRFRINVLLETLFALFSLITLSVHSSYIFNSNVSISEGLLKNALNLNVNYGYSISTLFTESLGEYLPLVLKVTATIAFSSLLLILIINYPRKKIKIDGEQSKCERYIIWARTVIVLPFVIYMIYKTLGF